MINSRNLTVLALLVGAFSAGAQEQQPEAAARFRLAQSLERAGDWERALPIYESLLYVDPQNYVYYDALRRGYIQLKQYEKAIELIHYRLTIQKASPMLLSALGGVYYQMGEESKADSIWQDLLRTDQANPALYRLVASQMMEYRLYDRAIALFLQARKATGDENLFTEELANLYGVFQRYANAAKEYVRMLRQQPRQLSGIQSRMSLFLSRPEALSPVREVIAQEVRRNGDSVPLRQLYAWVLMEEKNYEPALEQYKIIDRISNAQGVELLNFSQRVMSEGEYRTAATGFQEVLNIGPSRALVPVVRLGYARAVEELSAESDTTSPEAPSRDWPVSEANPSFGGAVSLYESVLREFPGTPYAAQALFRIGLIKLERLGDLDGALAALRRIPGIMDENPLSLESTMKIAEVLVAKNDLLQARQEYKSLLTSKENGLRERVLFRLAELDYFTAQFDTAAGTLRLLSSHLATDLANDALQLLYFIEEHSVLSPEALKGYAEAHLLLRQRRFSEALERFGAIVTQYPQAPLIDDATFKIADIQSILGKPRDALVTLGNIIRDMPSSILRDRAMMRSGEIHERVLKDIPRAIEAYEQLLAAFPGSLYAEEARRRIRLLRGDVL